MKKSITLPWEERSRWLRDALHNLRWSVAFAMILFATLLGWLIRIGTREVRTRQTYAALDRTRYAVERFAIQVGRCPSSLSELVRPPQDAQPFLKSVPTDGWGRALRVTCAFENNAPVVHVVSSGEHASPFDIDVLE